jgi:predicted Zn-ribbon and HTH transcriptional regulator
MTVHKIERCPNCKAQSFDGMDNEYNALICAQKDENGEYRLDHSKFLALSPFICKKCDYVMLFCE